MTVICSKCYKEVALCGKPAEEAFVYICHYYHHHKRAVTITEMSLDKICTHPNLLEYLEQRGFVVSTENSISEIALMPFGYCDSSGDEVICFCRHRFD